MRMNYKYLPCLHNQIVAEPTIERTVYRDNWKRFRGLLQPQLPAKNLKRERKKNVSEEISESVRKKNQLEIIKTQLENIREREVK